jgi:hypothetical protein
MAVSVSFTLTRGDLLRASWVSLRSHPFVLAQWVGFFIVFPWAFAAWQIVDAARGTAHVSMMAVLELVLIPPVAVIGFGAILLWGSRGSRMIGGHFEIGFTDEDIHLTSPGVDSRVQWPALTKCFGTRQGILFCSGNRPMLSVPGRTLSPEAAAELRAMAAARGLKIVGPWGGAPAA